jgi:hypothetical protein
MPDKSRKPKAAKLSRAAKDMHSKNPKVRKEAAEVMALAPRHVGKGRKR